MTTEDRNLIVGALDSLGVALTEHGHCWTDGERTIYEMAIEAAKRQQSGLEEIANAADQFEQYLAKNSGSNAEWAINIKVDSEDEANKLAELLTDLHRALKHYRERIRPAS